MKRLNQLCKLALLSLVMLLAMGTTVAFADTKINVHYFRYNADYSGWGIFVWSKKGNGQTFNFTETDAYGAKGTIVLDDGVKKAYFVIRKGNGDTHDGKEYILDLSKNNIKDIWLLEGKQKMFTSAKDADTSPRIKDAFMDAKDTIYAVLSNRIAKENALPESFRLIQNGSRAIAIKKVEDANEAGPPDVYNAGFELTNDSKKILFAVGPGFLNFPDDVEDGENVYVVGDMNNWCGMANGGTFTPDQNWKMTWNKSENYYQLKKDVGNSAGQVPLNSKFYFVRVAEEPIKYPGSEIQIIDFANTLTFVKLTLSEEVDPTKEYTLGHTHFKQTAVTKREVLNLPEFNYAGDDLGAIYSKEKTAFRVWAPTAKYVNLVLYPDDASAKGKEIPMKKDVKGTWKAEVKGDLKNKFYTYKVCVNGEVNETVDVYAKAAGMNGDRGAIVNLSETNPKNWTKVKRPNFKNPEDAIIYEVHVRDLTINPNSGVSAKNRGKFLGFTEFVKKGPNGIKTGIEHLKELGVTHVQLQPVYDFGSVDESYYDPTNYNWGYDPKNYNIPEGSYSSNPSSPTARIKEFKEMVKALHENGIRVIMDVVYNHTHTSGKTWFDYSVGTSWFDLTVPGYYYRSDKAGNYTNGSGCQNETASERSMMRKYMLDSLKYWVTEYGIDGFRFDLFALHDKDTMVLVEKELRSIEPGIILYGEPWAGGTSALKPELMMGKGIQSGMNIGVFNDNIRGNIKGDTRGEGKGFATGDVNVAENLKMGIMGSIEDFTADPGESINYATAHDDYCLWDKINASNKTDSLEDRKKMQKLVNAIVLTSQGVSFIHGGEEILRTKKGNHNSYNAGDAINNFDWAKKAENLDVFNYYKGMITLRKAHPAFRMTTANDIKANLQFINSSSGTIAYSINNNANGDAWKNIVVIYNANKETAEIELPGNGQWTVVVDDDEAGVTPVKTGKASFTGKALVPAISTMVLYQN